MHSAALFDLHGRYESVVSAPRPYQASWQEIRCRGCREADARARAERDAERDARLAMAGGRGRRVSRSRRDIFLDDLDPALREWSPPRGGCPHEGVGRAALRTLCEAFPELAFEMIWFLVPGFPDRGGGGVPRRFVLAKNVVDAVLMRWLVDRVSAPGDSSRYERGWGGRRYFRTTRGLTAPNGETGGSFSKAVRVGVGYAVAAWEMAGPVEELAVSPAARGEGPEPEPRLDEEVDATERLDVPVVLPDPGDSLLPIRSSPLRPAPKRSGRPRKDSVPR